MLDTYRGGYKKALLDLRGLITSEGFTYTAKSKKQFRNLVESLLTLLLEDPETLDHMLETGVPRCLITKDCICKPYPKERGDANGES